MAHAAGKPDAPVEPAPLIERAVRPHAGIGLEHLRPPVEYAVQFWQEKRDLTSATRFAVTDTSVLSGFDATRTRLDCRGHKTAGERPICQEECPWPAV